MSNDDSKHEQTNGRLKLSPEELRGRLEGSCRTWRPCWYSSTSSNRRLRRRSLAPIECSTLMRLLHAWGTQRTMCTTKPRMAVHAEAGPEGAALLRGRARELGCTARSQRRRAERMTPEYRRALLVTAKVLPADCIVPVPAGRLLELLAGSEGGAVAPDAPAPDFTVAQVAERFNRAPSTIRGWIASEHARRRVPLPRAGTAYPGCCRPRLRGPATPHRGFPRSTVTELPTSRARFVRLAQPGVLTTIAIGGNIPK